MDLKMTPQGYMIYATMATYSVAFILTLAKKSESRTSPVCSGLCGGHCFICVSLDTRLSLSLAKPL